MPIGTENRERITMVRVHVRVWYTQEISRQVEEEKKKQVDFDVKWFFLRLLPSWQHR